MWIIAAAYRNYCPWTKWLTEPCSHSITIAAISNKPKYKISFQWSYMVSGHFADIFVRIFAIIGLSFGTMHVLPARRDNHEVVDCMTQVHCLVICDCKTDNSNQSLKSKGKVVPVLNRAPSHADLWQSGGIAPPIHNLGTRWRWVVSFAPRQLYLGERALGSHFVVGWMGPKEGTATVAKRKNLCPCLESNPGRPTCSLVTIPTELKLSVKFNFFVLLFPPIDIMVIPPWFGLLEGSDIFPEHFRGGFRGPILLLTS
jgi:hypothetical protein